MGGLRPGVNILSLLQFHGTTKSGFDKAKKLRLRGFVKTSKISNDKSQILLEFVMKKKAL